MPGGVRNIYTADDLKLAVKVSSSWREVLKELGYSTSCGAISQRLRREAVGLGIDYSHFYQAGIVGTDTQITRAIKASDNWVEVAQALGFNPGSHRLLTKIKARAEGLGLKLSHLEPKKRRLTKGGLPFTAAPVPGALSKAATLIAAAWFSRRGYGVSFPVEPQVYDLLVGDGPTIYRIQVKTARRTARDGDRDLHCRIARTPKRDRMQIPYSPSEVDFFFVATSDGDLYIIPCSEVAGAISIGLGSIPHRKVMSP